MENLFNSITLDVLIRLSIALLLGTVIGIERVWAHKTAGMRTYALVSMGSALFVVVSNEIVKAYAAFSGMNPLMIISQIVVGVGFLGTGLIIFKDGHIENLTTASGMWAVAGIGMAVGFGMFREAIFATVLLFFVLGILSAVERSIRLRYFPDSQFEKKETLPKTPRKRTRKIAVESVS